MFQHVILYHISTVSFLHSLSDQNLFTNLPLLLPNYTLWNHLQFEINKPLTLAVPAELPALLPEGDDAGLGNMWAGDEVLGCWL